MQNQRKDGFQKALGGGEANRPRLQRSIKADLLSQAHHLTRPYTLHPTPYILHPTPCTLHPTPYTLHPAPYTLHPTPYTLHPTPSTRRDVPSM